MKWFLITIIFISITLFSLPDKHKLPINQSKFYQFKDGKKIVFPDIITAQKDIINDFSDPYFSKLTRIDLSIRMKKKLNGNLETLREDYKIHCQKSVISWTEKEIDFVSRVFKDIHRFARDIQPQFFPEELKLIKTNGSEESHLYYTRENCIIIPQKKINKMKYKAYYYLFMKTMIHELFHVYSRLNPDKRAQLYKVIGFEKKGNVALPPSLKKLRISNPDGNDYSYQIKVRTQDGREISVIPVIYSKYKKIQRENYYLFSYIKLGLFEVQNNSKDWFVVTDNNGEVIPYKPEDVQGFYEQIGRNTKYIIHPDEILADNVSIIFRTKGLKRVYVKDKNGVELLKKIEKVLRD